MIADFQDIESAPNGGVVIVTHRVGIETESDLVFSNCRTAEEARKIQGESRWSKRVRVVNGTIKQVIF